MLNAIQHTPKPYGNEIHRTQGDWDRIQALQIENLASMSQEIDAPEGNLRNRQFYLDALNRGEGIKEFGNLIPDEGEIQQGRVVGRNFYSTLHQQIQISLLAFKSGVSVSADLHEGGYDTHVDHDLDHTVLLGNATDALDYLWTYAEELGLADRLVLIVGSDFGRTPYYNAGAGKDHWPIGSFMVMEKNVAYTNQVIGETDGGHNAFKINSDSLLRDDDDGILIHPKHVHKALRRYLGIENSPITEMFPFNNTEDFDFFA